MQQFEFHAYRGDDEGVIAESPDITFARLSGDSAAAPRPGACPGASTVQSISPSLVQRIGMIATSPPQARANTTRPAIASNDWPDSNNRPEVHQNDHLRYRCWR